MLCAFFAAYIFPFICLYSIYRKGGKDNKAAQDCLSSFYMKCLSHFCYYGFYASKVR